MKKQTKLWNKIPKWGNLEAALAGAIRGNRTARETVAFRQALPDSLAEVSQRIREERGPAGDFHEFTIHDPKERVISAPCFADRVLHHAVMNVCEPVFERWLIDQTFACRTGLGTRAAINEAARWSSARKWYLQLDVRHYFETVPRILLAEKVERLFEEPEMIRLWRDLIFSHRPESNIGMPIGALTSQHLANFYLGFLDRFIKEQLRVRAYARYMDDLVLWHDDKLLLLDARERILSFAEKELGLEMKEPVLNRTSVGMNYLGFRFHPGWVGLAPRSRRRLRERIRTYESLWMQGEITELELQQRATAALAFAAPALTGKMGKRLSTIDY